MLLVTLIWQKCGLPLPIGCSSSSFGWAWLYMQLHGNLTHPTNANSGTVMVVGIGNLGENRTCFLAAGSICIRSKYLKEPWTKTSFSFMDYFEIFGSFECNNTLMHVFYITAKSNQISRRNFTACNSKSDEPSCDIPSKTVLVLLEKAVYFSRWSNAKQENLEMLQVNCSHWFPCQGSNEDN